MTHISRFYIIFFGLLSSFASSQEVVFETLLSKESLGINEQLKIEFKLNKDGDNFVPPSFKNFTIIGGPSQSVSHSWINGKSSFSKSYTYFLQPIKTGIFTIGQASILINGKTYKTIPTKIEVTSAVKQPNEPGNTTSFSKKDIFIIASPSKITPYLNELVTISYKLYWRGEIGVSNLNGIKSPKYSNFWSHDIKISNMGSNIETYEGRRYNTVTLKKIVLYPQITDRIKIEPLEVDLDIEVPIGKMDFFGRSITRSIQRTIYSNHLNLKVKALPEEGKPDNFTGAVGNFNFDVKLNKNSIKAGESLQASITLKGQGNLKLIKLPTISLPPSLETFDPEYKENIKINIAGGMRGEITNNYTIVPQHSGQFPFEVISFSYFDPKIREYKTLTSTKKIINVTHIPGTTTYQIGKNDSIIFKKNVTATKDQFEFIKTKTKLKPIYQRPFFYSKSYFIWLLSPLLIIPLVAILYRRKKHLESDNERIKFIKATKLSKKYLSEAKATINNKDAFFIAFEKALLNYLKAKLKIEVIDFDKQTIKNKLQEHGVQENTTKDFVSLLSMCEQARYANTTLDNIKNTYNKASENIVAIDKQFR